MAMSTFASALSCSTVALRAASALLNSASLPNCFCICATCASTSVSGTVSFRAAASCFDVLHQPIELGLGDRLAVHAREHVGELGRHRLRRRGSLGRFLRLGG